MDTLSTVRRIAANALQTKRSLGVINLRDGRTMLTTATDGRFERQKIAQVQSLIQHSPDSSGKQPYFSDVSISLNGSVVVQQIRNKSKPLSSQRDPFISFDRTPTCDWRTGPQHIHDRAVYTTLFHRLIWKQNRT